MKLKTAKEKISSIIDELDESEKEKLVQSLVSKKTMETLKTTHIDDINVNASIKEIQFFIENL